MSGLTSDLAEEEGPAEEVPVEAGRRIWRPFLSRADKARIVAAIAEQEARTTGEIHVHVLARTGERDILTFAQRKFTELGVDKTAERNGVLILISRWERRYAIWGDEGLHQKVGDVLWARARDVMDSHFAKRQFAEGIEACVREIGAELARHFPRVKGPGSNRVANEVSESFSEPAAGQTTLD